MCDLSLHWINSSSEIMFVAAEGCRRKLRPCRAVMRAKEMREEGLSSSALQVCREKKRGETKKSPSTAIAGMWRGGWEKIVNGFGGWGGVWSWSWVLSSLRLHEVPVGVWKQEECPINSITHEQCPTEPGEELPTVYSHAYWFFL